MSAFRLLLVTALVTTLLGACAGVPPGLEKEWARTEAGALDEACSGQNRSDQFKKISA